MNLSNATDRIDSFPFTVTFPDGSTATISDMATGFAACDSLNYTGPCPMMAPAKDYADFLRCNGCEVTQA